MEDSVMRKGKVYDGIVPFDPHNSLRLGDCYAYFNTLVLYGKIKPRSGRKRKRLLAFHAIVGHLDSHFRLRSHPL